MGVPGAVDGDGEGGYGYQNQAQLSQQVEQSFCGHFCGSQVNQIRE